MSASIAKIMVLTYFFGSFGLGQNSPLTIHIEDADGNDSPLMYNYKTDVENSRTSAEPVVIRLPAAE